MKLYIFQSGRELDVFGFTVDRAGSNLPREFAPWLKSREDSPLDTGFGDDIADENQSAPLSVAIQQHGYYVASSQTLSRITGIPWLV